MNLHRFAATCALAITTSLFAQQPAVPSDPETTAVISAPVPANDHGDIDFTSPPPFNVTGVLLKAKPDWPHVVAQTGTGDSNSAFHVYSSAFRNLFYVNGSGQVNIPHNDAGSFLNGRTKYSVSAGLPIMENVVHDVSLVNPRDSANGAANRITFFRSKTFDEVGSPAVTKYEAYTSNYYGQENISFDSHIWYHRGSAYHFRAVSEVENKETFWVKEATSYDAISQTRADMFVSGRTGLGVAAPQHKLHIVGDNGPNVDLRVGGRIQTGDVNNVGGMWLDYQNTTFVGQFAGEADRYGFFGTGGWQLVINKNSGNVGIGVIAPSKKLSVAGDAHFTGTVTAGNISAMYQDVAEWVPSASDLEPGTVVVLNPKQPNEVMAAMQAYDTRVAGVVSPQPGIILGEDGPSKEMIATTGRVRVKADARAGAIAIGDLLVTSDVKGMAMRSTPLEISGRQFHQPGTIIGKALEALPEGTGEILVLLSLQ